MSTFHSYNHKREFGSLFGFEATELPTTYVSKTQLEAMIPPELIAKAGTYTITVKGEGEVLPESSRAHLIVGFKE
jgi:hypothetical protein